jgi:hypothetical protein
VKIIIEHLSCEPSRPQPENNKPRDHAPSHEWRVMAMVVEAFGVLTMATVSLQSSLEG